MATTTATPKPTDLICAYCNRAPSAIPDIVARLEPGETPDQFAMSDGTYNPETKRFCCDECYVALGSPSGPSGWRAGDDLQV